MNFFMMNIMVFNIIFKGLNDLYFRGDSIVSEDFFRKDVILFVNELF